MTRRLPARPPTARPQTARLATALLATALLLAGGCAVDNGPPPAPGAAPDDLALRVEFVGGYVAPEYLVVRVPEVSVYTNGLVIAAGPVGKNAPGPALPDLEVRHISPANVDRLVALALAAGVGARLDFGNPGVADDVSTRFTVRGPNGVQVTDVYALGDVDGGSGVSADQHAARVALNRLVAQLTDLPGTLGPDALDQPRPYQAHAVAVVADPYNDTNGQPERAWPGPALPGPQLTAPMVHCLLLTGGPATVVLAAAQPANAQTPWLSGGARWRVGFRPLLPDDTDCASLVH